jgi:gluconate kinase
MQQALITNWIPYRLSYSNNEWTLTWLDLGKERMIHPFFDETISVCRCRQKERSGLESLSSAAFLPVACEGLSALAPSAFIFHVSRCGSTLLSQAFSGPEENIVVAEAPLLDDILRAGETDAQLNTASREHWFRAAIRLMGQWRNFKETAYIIKLDSWHIHFYELLREWFPQTPFFFLYRRPDEVIASHEKKRGIHAVPGMVNAGLLKTAEPATYQGDFNRYTAAVLEQYYLQLQLIKALHHPDNCFFDYADGVQEMVECFSNFSGIPVKDGDEMNQRLKHYSKAPQEVFQPEQASNSNKYFFEDCHAAYEQLKVLSL